MIESIPQIFIWNIQKLIFTLVNDLREETSAFLFAIKIKMDECLKEKLTKKNPVNLPEFDE